MRRLRLGDRIIVALVVPLWAACCFLHVREVASGRLAWVPLLVSGQGEDAYPVVRGFWPGSEGRAPGIVTGDRVLRVATHDLRGAGGLSFLAGVYAAAQIDARVPLTYARSDGEATTTQLSLLPVAYPWRTLPLSVGMMVVGLLVILRRPRSQAARGAFYGCTAYSLHWLLFPGGPPMQTRLWATVFLSSAFLMFPLILRGLDMLPESASGTRGRARRLLPWTFSAFGLTSASWVLGFPLPPDAALRATFVLNATFIVAAMIVLARNFLRADPFGRRQLKWLLLGVYVGTAPVLATNLIATLRPELWWLHEGSMVAAVAIPISLFIAIVRASLFDIDRLISETASYSILSVLLVAAAVLVVPRATHALGAYLESPLLLQVVLSLVMAVLVVPLQDRVRRQVERLFFEERHALERDIHDLLREIGECPDPRAVFTLTGTRLHRLLRPDSCVIYVQSGPAYTPAFAQGAGLPTAFRSGGSLVSLLAERRTPLVLERPGALGRASPLDAFDRAGLESLGAAVLLPVARGSALAAFVCLGEKRTGDVYVSSETALLAAVAEKMSSSLQHFDEVALYAQAREMQDALRRYVPGAIAASLESGGNLAARESEVTVLFVDIRGYTALSEGQRPETIFSMINRYTETVSRLVRDHGGTIVEFNGDGMMTVFGAPDPLPGKERAAVQTGRSIIRGVAGLRMGDGGQALSAGVGIATGPAFVGSIRAVDRWIWSAIGNTTNLAARLQSLTRELDAGIVIDATTGTRADAAMLGFEARPGVRIRGRSEPQDVFVLPLRAMPGEAAQQAS